MKFIAKKESTLLDALKEHYRDSSNKTLKQLLKFNNVLVNKKVEKNINRNIIIGDEIIIKDGTKTNEPKTKLHIIYEDKDIIAIDKPAGLLSISNDREKESTAYRLVSEYVKKTNKNNKIFVVHRLDEGTSGVLLFAKNKDIQDKLQSNWNDIVKVREYYCIVPGKTKNSGTIKSYLKVEKNNMVHSIRSEDGLLAITNYGLVKSNSNYSLLRVTIDTGRRNQIRVHMVENIAPILGDKKYGSKENPLGRLALHHSKITLIDPRTKKEISFKSNVPKSFDDLLK